MNTEELDDFELAIHDKLANYEVTPPEGSWNAIVNAQSTVKRNIRIIWFNKSSFFMVFISTMFTMWLAFGSITFDLNNYSDYQTDLLKSIRYAKELAQEQNAIDVNNVLENIDKQNVSKPKELCQNTEEQELNSLLVVETSSNKDKILESSTLIKLEQIRLASSPKELLINYKEEVLVREPHFSKFSIGLKASQSLLINKDSRSSLFQSNQNIGIEFLYPINKKMHFSTGLNYQRIYHSVSSIKTSEKNYTVTDTLIVGYIQDPLLGTIPVIELKDRDVNELIKTKLNTSNVLNGIEIPLRLSYLMYTKDKIGVLLNVGISYHHISSSNYIYLDDEGLTKRMPNISTQFLTGNTALEAQYKLTTRTGVLLNVGYNKNLAKSKEMLILPINTGAQLELGVKYKIF